MDESTRIKHLTKGLNATAQLHINLKSPDTTEAFLEALIKYDKWHDEESIRTTSSLQHNRHTTSNDMQHMSPQQEQFYLPRRQQSNYLSYQHQRPTRERIMSHAQNSNRSNRNGTCCS
jgi:hypothetical protein